MGKKLLWTAILTVVTAGAATLAGRLAAQMWLKATGEEPPATSAWATLLLGVGAKKLADTGADALTNHLN